jgi:hypothetical protein
MRVTLMGILIVMIIIAMWPMSFILDAESFHIPVSLDGKPTAVPIWCLYHPKISWTVLWHPGQGVSGTVPLKEITNIISKNHGPYAHFNTGWFLVTTSVLVVGYITRIQLLFFEDFTIWHTLLRAPKDQPSKLVETILSKLRDYRPVQRKQPLLRGMVVLAYKLAYALYAFVIIWKDVHSSVLWEVCFNLDQSTSISILICNASTPGYCFHWRGEHFGFSSLVSTTPRKMYGVSARLLRWACYSCQLRLFLVCYEIILFTEII